MRLPATNRTVALAALAALLTAVLLAQLLNGAASDEPRSVQVFAAPSSTPAPNLAAPPPSGLRVLVASMVSPRSSLDQYSGLVQLLGQRLGRPANLLLRKGYAQGNSALDSGEADLGFVCTGAYLRARQHGRAHHPLAVPVVAGKTTYHSQILVVAEHPARSVADLRGQRIAYVDPLSLTGYLWLQHRLKELGADPAVFFSATHYTGSHDRSVEAVAAGVADAAAVDSLIADAMLAKDANLARRLRVLERSPEFGSPPVVARADLPLAERQALTAALLGLHGTPEGAALLSSIGIERFVAVPADHFASVGALGQL